MLKFGPTGFDPKFLSNPVNFNLTEWFDAFPTDGGAGIPALAVDNPLTGLSLQLDSGFLTALFAEAESALIPVPVLAPPSAPAKNSPRLLSRG